MQAFGYYDPTSVAKATGIAADKSEGKYLAGGQSLLNTMKLAFAAPSDLIDLGHIAELRGIKVEGNGSAITIGAMTRHADVAGSLANDDPSSDYPAAVLGLGATINTDKRQIAADDFFKGLFETALAPGELIMSVTFPVPKKAAYVKFRNPASRFAVVGVFAAQTAQGPRIAVTGAGARGVFRVKSMEQALGRDWSAKAIESVAVPASEMQSDLHASAEYRAHLVNVLARRAVAGA